MNFSLKPSPIILGLLTVILIVPAWFLPLSGVKAAPAGQGSGHTPQDMINAVNQLRLANGLNALSTHPALMEAAQWEADAIAGGAPGHTHPPGLTLGAWLISLGYPLGGNIALDGYRSENWAAGTNQTVDETIQLWLGDAPHTNTMLSPQRSDIGAGVATGVDPWGNTVYYYVIETALQTSSGEQQYEAGLLLTSIPETMEALYPDGTQAALAASVNQYIVPITRSTARPDGDVVHEVKNGQSLWAIAIEYGVKINDIKLLNNLTSNEVYTGEKLLVQKSATQPLPTLTPTGTHQPSATPRPVTPTATRTPRPSPMSPAAESSSGINPTLVMFLVVVVAVVGLVGWLAMSQVRTLRGED
ncbi:MAG: LysM peptidoglycan-binding domain-containing protein [Anaerolineales bacterium]